MSFQQIIAIALLILIGFGVWLVREFGKHLEAFDKVREESENEQYRYDWKSSDQ